SAYTTVIAQRAVFRCRAGLITRAGDGAMRGAKNQALAPGGQEARQGGAMARLAGKVAVVTGAAGGIGKAISLAFAKEGARVGLLDNNRDLLAQAQADIPGATPLPCDVADRAAVRQAIDGFAAQAGGLDILVNNAAYFYYAPLVDMPEHEVDKMIDV